ncbi:MAG: cytochrome c3 family protein [Desulfobacterales bacterium]
MKCCALIISTIALLAAFLFVAAYAQEDMRVVANNIFQDPIRVSAIFAHDPHNESAEIEACSRCHHVFENGKRIEDESSEDQQCADCHELTASGNTPALMQAYHLNCKGCHHQSGKGPIVCGQCHKK